MGHEIYFRIPAYVVTIMVHISNMVIMISSFRGEPMKNHCVRHFSEMQCFFFTCWSFFLQMVYAIFALYSDILTLKNSNIVNYELPKPLVYFRDALFSVLVWPPTVLVFTMFWTLFYYDRSLVFPEDLDLVITNTSNHIMHTYILFATLWEVMFRPQKAPRNHTLHILCLLALVAIYVTVLIIVYKIRGAWVYPSFDLLNGSIYFHLLFVAVTAYLAVIYFSQWALTSYIWKARENTKKIY